MIGRRCCVTPTCVGSLVYSGFHTFSECTPVSKRIQAKREELAKRRDMLLEANKLLEDQRDDAGEADMLLHAERYDDLCLYPRSVLTPQQQQSGSPTKPANSYANNFIVHSCIYISDRTFIAPRFVVRHFSGPAPHPVIHS